MSTAGVSSITGPILDASLLTLPSRLHSRVVPCHVPLQFALPIGLLPALCAPIRHAQMRRTHTPPHMDPLHIHILAARTAPHRTVSRVLLHVTPEIARLRHPHRTRGSVRQLQPARVVARCVLALVPGADLPGIVLLPRMCGLEAVRAQGRPRLGAASGVLGGSGHGLAVHGGVPGSDVCPQLLDV